MYAYKKTIQSIPQKRKREYLNISSTSKAIFPFHTHTRTHPYAHTHTDAYALTHSHTHAYTLTHKHAHAHTYTHTTCSWSTPPPFTHIHINVLSIRERILMPHPPVRTCNLACMLIVSSTCHPHGHMNIVEQYLLLTLFCCFR